MRFTYRSRFTCTPHELFAFHERPDALELLTPPWARPKVLQPAPDLKPGSEALLAIPLLGPIRKKWLARHTVYEPPHRFVDEQVSGPFKKWRHEHIIREVEGGSELIDQIDYEVPFGVFGRIADRVFIDRMLKKMFAFRHEVTGRHCG